MLTLYEFRKAGKKTVSNFMYGLYTKEEEGETWKRRLAFLLEVKREPEGMGFQVLSGLFGLDARGVKVFYIPIKRKQAEEQAREQPREQAQEQSQERAQQQPQEHSE